MPAMETPRLNLDGDASSRRDVTSNIYVDVRKAQEELARLQQEKEEIDKQREEVSLLNRCKHDFIVKQAETVETLAKSLTDLEREIEAMRREVADLESIYECFRHHLLKAEDMDIERWTEETTPERLREGLESLEGISTDYKDAVLHCTHKLTRTKIFDYLKAPNGSIMGQSLKASLYQGLVFNLPLVILGIIALLIYCVKG